MIPTALLSARATLGKVVTNAPLVLPAALRSCTARPALKSHIDTQGGNKDLLAFAQSLKGVSSCQSEFTIAGHAPIHHWTKRPDENGHLPQPILDLEAAIKRDGMSPELILKPNEAMHGNYLHAHFTWAGLGSHFGRANSEQRSYFIGFAHGDIARQPYMSAAPTIKSSDPATQLKFPISVFPREADLDKKVLLSGSQESLALLVGLHLNMMEVEIAVADEWGRTFGYENHQSVPGSTEWYAGAAAHVTELYRDDPKWQAFEKQHNGGVILEDAVSTVLTHSEKAKSDQLLFQGIVEHLDQKGALNLEGRELLAQMKELTGKDSHPTLTI